MKHVTFADKSLFIDDETADLLIAYANAIGRENSSDTVRLRAIGADGNEVEVELLLNSAAQMATETTNSVAEAPRDEGTVEYLRSRLNALLNPPNVRAHEPVELSSGSIPYEEEWP